MAHISLLRCGFAPDDGLRTYSYDAEGNLLTANGISYVYDAFNNRVSASQTATPNVGYGTGEEYLYDPSGHRTSSWITSINFGSAGRIYWDYGLLANRSQNGTTYFHHSDWLGTERRRTDFQGNVVDLQPSLADGESFTQWYDPTGASQDNAQYTGQEYDAETATDHFQYRQYQPAQGRWLSPDPYDGSYDYSNPQSFNRYAYVLNNPLSLSDPNGLQNGEPSSGGAALDCGWCDAIEEAFKDLIDSLFSSPEFHGSLEARPSIRHAITSGHGSQSDPMGPNTPFKSFNFVFGDPAYAPSKPTKPCNDANNNRSRFFQQLPGLTSVANQLNVSTNFIVGLSSFESGWFDNHNVALNNLWGLTQGGGNNIQFSSIQAGNSYFVSRVGPFIQGAQTQAAFFKGLQAEGYNSVNPNYYPTLANRINNIQSWGQACGVSF